MVKDVVLRCMKNICKYYKIDKKKIKKYIKNFLKEIEKK